MEENKNIVEIPFVAHESSMQRMESSMDRLERANRRLWIVILVMIVGFMIYLFIPSDISDNSQEATADNESQIEQKIGD